MPEQNEAKLTITRRGRKMPLDARIIGWAMGAVAFVPLLLGFLFLIGFSYITSPDTRPALFGTISLSSELKFGIYWGCIGLVLGFSAYGIIKGRKLGWLCLLILSVNSIFNGLAMLPRFKVSILITTGINIGIITWLVYRRRLYNITGKGESYRVKGES
jgi:hypothetical protein